MSDFWDNHSLVFAICLCLFPRLTMLLATSYGAGFLYWLGWLLAPRLTVAIIGTILYRDTNTVLLIFVWLWALVGEAGEKHVV